MDDSAPALVYVWIVTRRDAFWLLVTAGGYDVSTGERGDGTRVQRGVQRP